MQLLLLSLCVISHVVRADIYMHNPRGSNDRGCETNENRNNGNRLFDSQNNAKGGYACQAAYPFACYLDPNNAAVRAQCNALNNDAPDDLQTNGFADRMDNGGLIVNNQPTVGGVNFATRTDRMKFVEGSQLTVEWTNQHGCGDNPKSHCDIIIQYACEDTLTDDCGLTGQGKTCGPRDGLPITNSDQDRGNAQYQNFLNPNQNININRRARDRDATETIPVSISNNVQSDPRFGRHESLRYFEQCASRERNKGLFAADQNLNGNTAQTTRQNNNANRNGLECAEESEYFPYWHPSPWKDAAILTDQIDRCAELQAESQNVKAKNFCECPTCRSAANPNSNKLIPNNEAACLAAGGTWKEAPAFGIAAPFCGKAPTSRENHLGNQVGQGSSTATAFNWTIPTQAQLGGNTCVLRIRYNISTGDDISEADPRDITIFGTNAQNGQQSSIKDRNNNEAQTYVKFLETNAKVGLAINTNQFGRTFQDRSYTFSIVARNDQNAGPCAASGKIYNLNVRGKRGNIVQVYPAVEYDFVPSELAVTVDDCVHVQWTGSDYNPARNDNDAFGGPNDPKNMNNGRADRSNIVPLDVVSNNIPAASLADDFNMFSASLDQKMRLVFLDQNINDANACLDIVALQALSKQAQQNNNLFNDNGNNFLDQDQDRDRFFKNCAKLSGQRTPYFNGGVLKAGTEGTHLYFSSRNTCFSNRDQRGFLHVLASGAIPADAGNPEKNTDGPAGGGIGAPPQAASANGVDPVPIAAGVGGTFAALIGLAGLVAYSRRSSKSSRGESSSSPMYGLKDKAMDTFSNFRQSFANFGSSAGFQGFGSPQSSPTGNNGGGGGGFFRQSMAQFTNTFRPQTQQPSSPMGGGGGSMMSAGGMGMGMSMGGGYPQSVPRSPMPPPMMMSQPNVQRATAMYDHKAGESGELSFNKGDVITVMRRDASGWWEGECNGQRGIFPANYVRVQSAGWN